MSSVIRVARRHKKKLIFMGVLFSGGYLGLRYLQNKLEEALSFPNQDSSFLNLKKCEHYMTIKQTSDEAIIDLMKTELVKINERLSSNDLLEQLKQKPPNKVEIWEKLKILSVSRCLSKAYSISILTLFVKVELNIIGGYLFLSNESRNDFNDENPVTLSASIQQRFLLNIENFVKQGLPKMSEKIYKCCEKVFAELSLRDEISVDILNSKFDQVRNEIENDINFVNEFLLCDIVETKYAIGMQLSTINKFKSDEEVLNEMNQETCEILKSSDFNLCLKSLVKFLLNELFNQLTSEMIKEIFSSEVNHNEKITISLPFAKLIPILDRSQVIYEYDNEVLYRMLDDLKLNIFGANIYEAFSSTAKFNIADEANSFIKLKNIFYGQDTLNNILNC
jgi:peroxin-3